MTHSAAPRAPTVRTVAKIRFAKDDGFHAALRQRVEAHFQAHPGRHGGWALGLKTALILIALAGAYGFLVWGDINVLQAVALAMAIGLLSALVGFNIQHDGGHQAFSAVPWRNRLAAATLDIAGASSYVWNWKHAVYHHGFPNLSGHDTDIDVSNLVRLEPHQPLRAHHRWQFLYIWFLYGIMAMRWQILDDFRDVAKGRIGPHRIPQPKGLEVLILYGGKAIFFALAFGIPMWFHPPLQVLGLYAVMAATLGVFLSVVFQLAHNTGLCEFPAPPEPGGRMAHSWAVHQIQTSADFARDSRLATWFLGGLNFQIEHHLFPHVSHVHYPALSRIVEETCRDHGIAYRDHGSFLQGFMAHVRWLRDLGRPAPQPAS